MIKEKPKKPDIRSELLRQLSQAVLQGDVTGGLRLAEKAGKTIADRDDPRTGQFRCLEARLFFLSGDYQKTLASSRLAASLLAPFGETEDLARAYLLSGKALVSLGNYREAETALLDAISLFRRCDNVAERIDAANQLARVYFTRAEYKSALKYLLDTIKLADRQGDRRKLAFLWGNLGRVYTLLGNLKKAAEALRLNLEISDDLDDEKEKAKALLSLGYIGLQNEQYEKAESYLDEAQLIIIANGMRREMVIHHTYLGELKTKCGDHASARRLLNEAIDGARSLAPESSLMAAPLRHLAALELAEDNASASSRLANKVLALTKKIGELVEKGAALRILAQATLAEGKNDGRSPAKAADLFAEALEVFDEIDARFEKAETFVQMAVSGLGSSHRILVNLFRAADIYQKLGISSKHQKTQELINQFEAPAANVPPKESVSSNQATTIVTANRKMKKIMRDIGHAAKSEMPVLLIGETGTGKDLLARHYHAMSGRQGRFVAVNCAAFPDTLLESELFGYRRGAFTGAVTDKDGLLQRADGGTFFLDEIGEMSPASQAKLLTVIETCQSRPLGGLKEDKLDLRIITATNCDLAGMVEEGRFRRDLYYRLSGITFTIPPLAERPEDIPLLLHHFLCRQGVIGEDQQVDMAMIAEFTSRSWPGNVRQLESEVKKLVLFSTMAREDTLGDLAGLLVQNDIDGQTTSLFSQIEEFERTLILKALRRADWNKSKAARSLAIHESTLRAKMKRYHLAPASVS